VPKQEISEVSCEERCEKMEAAFRMVWGYSHEISDYVTVLMGNSELLQDALSAQAPLRKHMDEITRCARRIGSTAGKISSLREHFTEHE